ncbi:MAG: DUF1318 domain-containing protein [Desulfovibrionaceae bacterium]|jgi:uncharacterized protein YdbL (DUF1318 family)|nr:DUF1318 domain-containing protein [Desulfovibrionaceae bacterium]
MRFAFPATAARVALLALLFTACVTVNIYFPAARVEHAAEDIVEDVYGKPQPTGEAKEPTSQLEVFLALLGPAEAHAAEATTVSNAAIRGLKQQIAQNHKQLAPFYASGNLGIGRDGFLVIRSQEGMAVPQVAQLKRLVDADNEARAQLYKEVAAALQIDATQLTKVQAIFADEWRDQAPKGWWVQDNGGAWKQR